MKALFVMVIESMRTAGCTTTSIWRFNLKPGDRLVARKEGNSLVLEPREVVVKRLQARFSHIPPEVKLVDELICERREAAAKESKE